MSTFKHELLLASAGTGKTFRLTSQFLALLLAGVEPERVLATTFTRKAAGEILDRVLERLVDATDSEEGLAELSSALGDASLDADKCRALLVKLTRGLDTFQVRTIDSFFVHLVRLFALDLELPPNWSLSDDREDQVIQGLAMQDVLEGAERGEMLELLRDIQKGGAGRGVQAALLKRARELRPIALESAEGAWSTLTSGGAPDEAEFERARQALPTAPMAQTAKGDEMKNWAKSRDSILAAIDGQQWSEIFSKGLGAASLAEDPKFHKKPLSEDLLEILAPIVKRAKYEELSILVNRNVAVHSLLERFEECYATRKREAARFRFDDLPLALAPNTARARLFDEREAELWFRLDGRIDHLMLDEFQDTAPMQWRILEPLASEITSVAADERSFFCVGDVKQSIYGFRQAEPRLLANMESKLQGLVAEHMDESYRSSQTVLDAVNMVFGELADNPAFAGDELAPHRAAAKSWSTQFDAHKAARELPGVVHVVEAAQPAEGVPKGRPLIDCAVRRVAAIHAEAPLAKIGVLTRVNKNIPLIIHDLRELDIEASGEGGNALTDSKAVLVYISLLHLIDHPSDSAAAFHVRTSLFADYVGLASDADSDAARKLAREQRAELLNVGLGAWTAQLAERILDDEQWSSWDKARFTQLADQAYSFESQLTLRTSDFVDHLRTNRVESPGAAQVRVMTVHASKGLEFDAVVLPELNSSLVGQRDSYLVDRPDPEGLIEAVMLSPGKKLLMLSEELERLYHSTTGRSVVDGLCSLYVAMTRAKYRLEMIVPWVDPEKEASDKVVTYADVVHGALPAAELRNDDADGVLWSSGESEWANKIKGTEATAGEAEPELLLAPTTAPRSMRRRSASAEEGGSTVSTAELLGSRAGARVGTLVHAAFEDCEWIEDFQLDAARLSPSGVTPEVSSAAAAIVERALGSDEVRSALSRESCAAPAGCDLRVEREHEFSLIIADEEEGEQFWNGAIDRLVLAEQDGKVVWAEVLDYKSDRVTEDQLAERAEHYRPQLEAYARVVEAQTGLPAQKVVLRLAFLATGRVVELPTSS